MEVTSNLLRILNCLSTEDKQKLLNVDAISTSSSTKGNQVIGSLVNNEIAIARRLPIDSEKDKLADLEEKIGFVFHRFIGDKIVNIFYTDGEGCRTALDSDEKLEEVFKTHQQKFSAAERFSSFSPLQLDIEVVENLASMEPLVGQELIADKDLIVCDGCGEMLATGLGYKCLHCNSVHICAHCETLSEKHSDHFMISCLALMLGTSQNSLSNTLINSSD